MSWQYQRGRQESRGKGTSRGLGARNRTWHRQETVVRDVQAQADGQSWDPFRPVEPLAPTPANLAAPQKPIEAQMGVMPGTYARQRPNQLVRAALGNSSLADGAHVKTCANTVAPLHVSSSLAVPALSGPTPPIASATAPNAAFRAGHEASSYKLPSSIQKASSNVANEKLQHTAASPSAAAHSNASIRSGSTRYLRKRPNQLCRLPSQSPSMAPLAASDTASSRGRRSVLVVRQKLLTSARPSQRRTAPSQGLTRKALSVLKPQHRSRVYIRAGSAVLPSRAWASLPKRGAASQASPAEQQQGSLVQKHVQNQTPVKRPVYKHVGRGKLQLLVSKDKAAAINRSQQQNAWVRPGAPLRRKAVLIRKRLPSDAVRDGGKVLTRRPVQLRRIGGQMYRLVTNGAGHTLQRQQSLKQTQQRARQTPRPLVKKAARYVRQGSRLVRVGTPAAARQSVTLRGGQKSSVAARLVARAVIGKRSGAQAPRAQLVRRSASSHRTMYCPKYCRTGVCAGQANGQCTLVHDKSKVAVCSAWLSGSCSSSAECTLQHKACPDLMPLCQFYLKGSCTKENCPYLHRKIDLGAPVCRAFVEGVCLRGALCPHKHLTARMVKELRASRSLVTASEPSGQVKHPGAAADPAVAAAEEAAVGEKVVQAGVHQKKRKWRYFWGEEGEDS